MMFSHVEDPVKEPFSLDLVTKHKKKNKFKMNNLQGLCTSL